MFIISILFPASAFPLLEQILQIPPPEPQYQLDLDGETLKYEVKWSRFRSAEAWVSAKKNGDHYQLKGYAHTIGFPRTLWRMDDWGETELTKNFTLVNYELHTRETFTNLDINMTYDTKTKIATIKRLNLRNSKLTYKQIELYQGFDASGLACLVRALEWKPGQKRYFEFTDGAERYIILISAGPVEKITVPAGTFDTIRLDPYLFRIPRKKAKEKPETLQSIQAQQTWKKIAEYAQVWLALSGTRPFVLVKGKAFIGEVSMELVEITHGAPPNIPFKSP